VKTHETEKVLAFELGRLDAKHNMGYFERPGYREEYRAGYNAGKRPEPAHRKTAIVGSYADKTNWGWY
jgi:hypothetical protein